jgi:hypothetical protein
MSIMLQKSDVCNAKRSDNCNAKKCGVANVRCSHLPVR